MQSLLWVLCWVFPEMGKEWVLSPGSLLSAGETGQWPGTYYVEVHRAAIRGVVGVA